MSKFGVFSGPYFPVFGLKTGKYGPEKTPYLDTFHTVFYNQPNWNPFLLPSQATVTMWKYFDTMQSISFKKNVLKYNLQSKEKNKTKEYDCKLWIS